MKYSLTFLILLLAALPASAQKDSLVLDGTLTLAKSATYKYKLVVGLEEGKWKGYSLLDAGGPDETKSSVSIRFSKEKQSLMFAEKALISSKSKETTFCFVGGVLKMNEKKNQLKGFFLGQDNNKKMCGSGTVRFTLTEEVKKLMTPDGTKDTNTADIVTSFKSQSYKVSNSQVKIELWDGGVNDHDSLSLSLNGETILPGFEIVNEKRVIRLTLKKGENIIKIKALNEGFEAPNSARINIIDQASQYPLVSFLRKGEEATMKVRL